MTEQTIHEVWLYQFGQAKVFKGTQEELAEQIEQGWSKDVMDKYVTPYNEEDDSLTVAEIKAILTENNIKFNAKAKKAELLELLEQFNETQA